MTLCKRCGFTVDGPLHRDFCPVGAANGATLRDLVQDPDPVLAQAADAEISRRLADGRMAGYDRMAAARAAFASLIQRDGWMLNRYGTGERCPIVLDGTGAYACLVHEDGTAEATSTRCSESERLARIASEPGPSYLGIEL
jgi:hypothetical protein